MGIQGWAFQAVPTKERRAKEGVKCGFEEKQGDG
jgi:hypothetical protein